MSDGLVIAVELASVSETADRDRLIWILAWGDRVEDVLSGYQRDRARSGPHWVREERRR